MTITKPAIFQSAAYTANTAVKSGMIVECKYLPSKKYAITINYMKAKERMLLEVPLDLRLMDEADWDALPGIGPKTARDIVTYRQNNGGFSSLDELKNIPGISDGKFLKIASFFYPR
jgi:competence ComEA-like helix-hairpin-helix protein